MRVEAEFPLTLPCKIALIAEAPGSEESNAGRPFIGPSGKLLNSMLAFAEIKREECLVTNVFTLRPPANEVGKFFIKRGEWKKLGHKSPFPAFADNGYLNPTYEGEIDRLKGEILRAKPSIVVCLGATALWALTGETKISNYRGSLLQSTLLPNLKVLPTFHPAAILRDYSLRVATISDLVKAKRESNSPSITTLKRNIWLCEGLKDLKLFHSVHLSKSREIAFDIETERPRISHLSLASSPTAVAVLDFLNMPEEEEIACWLWLVENVFHNRELTLVAHNSVYDLTYLALYGIFPWGKVADTMLLHHSIQPEMQKSLGFLGSLYLTERSWKTLRVKSQKNTHKDDE